MTTYKIILAAAALSIAVVAANTVLPVQSLPRSASATQAATPRTECPPATSEGAYFERGRDKDGNAICGFAWYNACPYTEAVAASDPMCEKSKPTEEQLQPWQLEAPAAQPTTPTVTSCEGK